MKKALMIFFSVFLAGCNITAATPEDALQKLDSREGTFKINKIVDSASDNQKQGFYVFEGQVEDGTEWFVANVATNDFYWYVKEFAGIGTPSNAGESSPTEAATFIAGLSNEPKEKKDGTFIIHLPKSDYFVWIEVIENQK